MTFSLTQDSATCPQCETVFRKTGNRQKYDKESCKRAARRGQAVPHRTRKQAYYRANRPRELVRERELKYGVTPEDFARMLELQDGSCAIIGCGKTFLVVDHEHATGAVRGLLCRGCNAGIGMLRDQPELLRAAAMYLS